MIKLNVEFKCLCGDSEGKLVQRHGQWWLNGDGREAWDSQIWF